MGTVEESHSLEAAERASPFPNQSGYWRGGALEETVYECLDGRSSCVGGNVTGEYCAPHHHGPLCSLCDQGSYHLSAEEGACTACSVASCWPPAAPAALALALLVRSVVRGGHGGGAVSHMSKEVRLFRKIYAKVGGRRGWVGTEGGWRPCGASVEQPAWSQCAGANLSCGRPRRTLLLQWKIMFECLQIIACGDLGLPAITAFGPLAALLQVCQDLSRRGRERASDCFLFVRGGLEDRT